jgi:DNA-3-methyladenine glycosylase
MVASFIPDEIYLQEFFDRPTLRVARDLLGPYLVVRRGRSVTVGKIVETEAYIGTEDPACHAFRGMTPRNRVMFGPPGFAYVYFTYGNHFMLNFVTEREGFPAAVLIRAAEPVDGLRGMIKRRGVTDPHRLCRGPGNLTAAFGIDRSFNGLPLTGPQLLVGANRGRRRPTGISGRVGINDGSDKPWRFFLRDHPCVSAYRMGTKAAQRNAPPRA